MTEDYILNELIICLDSLQIASESLEEIKNDFPEINCFIFKIENIYNEVLKIYERRGLGSK